MEKFAEFEKNYKTFNGYLSADAELKYFDSGKCKCTFSIPLKKDDKTIWLNCETWSEPLSEKIANNYKKGSEITVVGYFKKEEYNGKEYIKFIVKMAD